MLRISVMFVVETHAVYWDANAVSPLSLWPIRMLNSRLGISCGNFFAKRVFSIRGYPYHMFVCVYELKK